MLKEHPDARILAGGTNVLVDMKLEKSKPAKVIDITHVPGLAGIAEDGSGVRIGALTPIRALSTSALLWTSYTALAEAAAAFGSTQIAMRGTLGGNICNGSPASDTVPALLVLGAEAILASASGERVVPLGDLLSGPGKVRLRDGEILTGVRLPKSVGTRRIGIPQDRPRARRPCQGERCRAPHARRGRTLRIGAHRARLGRPDGAASAQVRALALERGDHRREGAGRCGGRRRRHSADRRCSLYS